MKTEKLLICLLLSTHISLASAKDPSLGPVDKDFVAEVFEEICRQQIRQAELVMRQVILETGWLRAKFLMSRQNLFGFRHSSYLVFDHWKDSVAYYKAWQEKHYPGDQEDYIVFLKRIRYATPDYGRHLQKIQWTTPCPIAAAPVIAPDASDTASPLTEPPSVPAEN